MSNHTNNGDTNNGDTDNNPLPVILDNIPPSLRSLKQWVGWRLVNRDGNLIKTPVQPSKRFAKSNDPSTWSVFAAVRNSYTRGDCDGIGFMLADAGDVIMIDLDGCRDSTTGEIRPWSDAIRSQFHDPATVPEPEKLIAQLATYAEVSPSGTGFRLFARGSLPPGGRKIGGKGSGCPDGFEVYSSRRYGTVTGHRLPDVPHDLTDATNTLAAIHAAVFGAPSDCHGNGHAAGHHGIASHTGSNTSHTPPTDAQIVDRASRASNGDKFLRLWRGEDDGYSSGSEADFALAAMLAFWTGPDPGAIERLMRQSALVRDKWDKNKEYLPRTAAKALEGRHDFFEWHPTGSSTHSPKSPPIATLRTETGLAERFARDHNDAVRFCHTWGKWLVWDGRRWQLDDTAEVDRLAKQTVRRLYDEAAGIDDDGDRKAAATFARQSESANRRRAMLALAKSEPPIPIRPADLDQDPWALNCENGTLDLRTATIRPHRRGDGITKLVRAKFDPDAECPHFRDFLASIFEDNADLISFVQRLLGYCLTGVTPEHILPIFHGSGSNGKSTLLETVLGILGPDYSMKGPSTMLVASKQQEHPTAQADLFGKRLVCCVETSEGARLDESLVKELTGGDTVRARRMREDFWQFTPTHKIILCTNHRPIVRGTDHAIWRRLRLVPFAVKIPDDQQDKHLGQKLHNEAAGILRWLVDGCRQWGRLSDLAAPPEVKVATMGYQAEQDVIGAFIDEVCIVHEHVRENSGDLYAAYREWAKDSGEYAVTQKRFGMSLTERGFVQRRDKARYWQGVGLASVWEQFE